MKISNHSSELLKLTDYIAHSSHLISSLEHRITAPLLVDPMDLKAVDALNDQLIYEEENIYVFTTTLKYECGILLAKTPRLAVR